MLGTGCERASPEFRGEVCAGGISLGTANAHMVFKAINYEKPKQGAPGLNAGAGQISESGELVEE